jgi:hypothetical protein
MGTMADPALEKWVQVYRIKTQGSIQLELYAHFLSSCETIKA